MRNIRNFFDQKVSDAEKKWNALSLKKQKRSTKFFFSIYFLLTMAVLIKIWMDSKNEQPIPVGGHIDRLPGFDKPQKKTAETFKIPTYDK